MGRIVAGVDVGGTNTDAVLLDGTKVIGSYKHMTTPDVTTGVMAAIQGALSEAKDVEPSAITSLMIGTTHFVNAVVQRKDLSKVGVIRLCGPSSHSMPPFGMWPEDLTECIKSEVFLLPGGLEFTGAPMQPIDVDKVKEAAELCKQKHINRFAVTGVFAPLNAEQEIATKKAILEVSPDAFVTISTDVGGIGLIERENAAILNSTVHDLAKRTIHSMHAAFKSIGISGKVYLTRNDGTLVSMERAIAKPLQCFTCGPSNSMRGAVFLTGKKDGLVIDVGGTTADIGVLVKGFPRVNIKSTTIGGVATNFRTPDVLSIGIGGGSIVSQPSGVVGPQSVGFTLTKQAKIFGGEVVTASDIAVCGGLVKNFGTHDIEGSIDKQLINNSIANIRDQLEVAIDSVKTQEGDLPAILVGGGSFLVGNELKGVSHIENPRHYSVANAIGATIAQVSGEAEKMVVLNDQNRKAEIDTLFEIAKESAIRNGAVASSVELVDVEEIGVQYIPGGLTKVKVIVVGDAEGAETPDIIPTTQDTPLACLPSTLHHDETQQAPTSQLSTDLPHQTSVPTFDSDGCWVLNETDIHYIAYGAGVLGSGGGGATDSAVHRAHQLFKTGGKTIRVKQVKQMQSNESAFTVAYMGAPGVLSEKLPKGDELLVAAKQTSEVAKKEISYFMVAEVGGLNAIEPLMCAAVADIPCLDADGMGRAFPELRHWLPWITKVVKYGPLSMTDAHHNMATFTEDEIKTVEDAETRCRTAVVKMGCVGGLCLPPLSKDQLVNGGVEGSISRAWTIGRTCYTAIQNKQEVTRDLCKLINSTLLMRGKIVETGAKTDSGFTKGYYVMERVAERHSPQEGEEEEHGDGEFKFIRVDMQNEYLIATKCKSREECIEAADKHSNVGKVVACVPDLLFLLDARTQQAIPSDEVHYGRRVHLYCAPAHPKYTTDATLAATGPHKFGYSHQYIPTSGKWKDIANVWDQFAK